MIAIINKTKAKFYIIIIWLIISTILFNTKFKQVIIKQMYPTTYANYIESYAEEYGVEKEIIYAIIKAESNFNESAKSNKDAVGLMQLIPSTAEEIANKLNVQLESEDLLNAEININLGTKYISSLIGKYESLGVALAAYNAGSGNVDNWINNGIIKEDGSDLENIPYKETNNYVRKILRDYEIYKQILNG